jgi:hypothetical protein
MAQPDLFVLRPGWNEFPAEIFELHKNDPEIKAWIKSGDIVISDVKVGAGKKAIDLGAQDVEVHLAEIKDEKKCIEIVNGTFNRDLLQRWIDEETRSKVKRALSARMKDLFEKKDD